jgi:hypothetical protein
MREFYDRLENDRDFRIAHFGVEMPILQTTDYSQFKLYNQYHRPISHDYMRLLQRQILTEGQLIPIDVTPDLEIVDGRHRFLIARRNRLPLRYQVTYKTEDYHNWMLYNEGRKVTT